MLSLSLFLIGVLVAMVAGSILYIQDYNIKKGKITLDPEYDGPAQVSVTLLIIIRYLLKRSVHFRKFVAQYIFHIVVLIMRHVDNLSSLLYSKSRNWFVKNAVRNRGTVPHFWKHLKVYKQEMDKEREKE